MIPQLMKPALLLYTTLFAALASCTNAQNNGADAYGSGTPDALDPMSQASPGDRSNNSGSSEKLTLHPVMDAKTGMVSYRMPLPESWKIMTPQTAEEPHIVGPGGVKVYYRSGSTNMFSNDPNMQQVYQMSGQAMRRPMPVDAYLQQDILPQMTSNGFQLLKQYPLPQVAERNRAYSAKLFKSAPSQEQHSALGTEWKSKEGKPVFMIVNMTVSQGQNDVYWFTSFQLLEAEESRFANAKRSLLNGIINTQDNPQQIAAYNANEQQKTNQSWSQHNARMQQNQRNFDQQQRTHRETQDAINKSSMDAYNSRQESNDRIQNRFNNYIMDENTVTNPEDGKRYQVESGADQYWMNSNGEYVPSNNALYDPNTDPALNNQQWQEVEIEP